MRVFLWISVLTIAVVCFDWTTSFHLVAGALLTAPIVLALVWMRFRRRTSTRAPLSHRVNPRRLLLFNGLGAGLLLGYLAIGFLVLHKSAFGGYMLDGDRVGFEANLQLLEESHGHAKAAEIVEARLGQSISDAWRLQLAERLTANLVEAGKVAANDANRKDYFLRAQEAAQRFSLSDSEPRHQLELLERKDQFTRRLARLCSNKDWATLTTVLEAALVESLDRNDDKDTIKHLAEQQRDALLCWSGAQETSEASKAKLDQAIVLCRKHSIEDVAVRYALEMLAKGQSPAPLPHGSKGDIVQLWTDHPPILVLDVALDAGNGVPIETLQAKDFQVSLGGKSLDGLALRNVKQSTVKKFHIAIAFDTSGSMNQDNALAFAKTAVQSFMESLAANQNSHAPVCVEIIQFDQSVRRCCDWTTDLRKAATAVESLKADGATALYQAIQLALNDLSAAEGSRHLVLFTDGADTVGGPALADLIRQAQEQRIQITTIGLKTDDLDASVLQRLAKETGGDYSLATSPKQLVQRYRGVAQRFRPHCYRLALLMPDAVTDSGLEVRIGSENSVVIQTKLNK